MCLPCTDRVNAIVKINRKASGANVTMIGNQNAHEILENQLKSFMEELKGVPYFSLSLWV